MEILRLAGILLLILMVLLGNATKLGNKEASQYTTNDKFKTLSGTVTLTAGSGTCQFAYPTGFAQNNCIPISYGQVYNSQGWKGFGYVQNAIKTGARLSPTYITYNAYDEGGSISGTFPCEVVLMRTN